MLSSGGVRRRGSLVYQELVRAEKIVSRQLRKTHPMFWSKMVSYNGYKELLGEQCQGLSQEATKCWQESPTFWKGVGEWKKMVLSSKQATRARSSTKAIKQKDTLAGLMIAAEV